MRIDGSAALVVGGAGGLGESTARRLHTAGARVVIADLADDKGKALEDGLGAQYVRTDATDEDSMLAAVEVAEHAGEFRIAVDCHGGRRAAADWSANTAHRWTSQVSAPPWTSTSRASSTSCAQPPRLWRAPHPTTRTADEA
ncbi:SDR family NAD(P)-dependent oxidoreductase [Streptomyces sp. NPDC005373]|uniref:SDR family NAD(P)-dependent oxidoreductase n=1 Tax=Streptomyces sp. NPDC005373 TaxID=3156879 RepID=UPI0033A02231